MQLFKTKKIIIDKSQTNKRLDQVLTKLIGKYSRSQIKILLQNKNVKISNKIIINASYKVKEGEIFYIKNPKKNLKSKKLFWSNLFFFHFNLFQIIIVVKNPKINK